MTGNNNILIETALNKLGNFRRTCCSKLLCRLFSRAFKFFATFKKTTELRGNAMCCILFFWVIPRRLNFMCRRFGKLCSIFIGRGRPMKMETTRGSETSPHEIQTPENHPKERLQHSIHDESSKSRNPMCLCTLYTTCAFARCTQHAQQVFAAFYQQQSCLQYLGIG